jgi:hypothetical protein
VPIVGAGVAAVRDIPVDVVESASWDNAARLFGLSEPDGTG